jgi:hypothetical protein
LSEVDKTYFRDEKKQLREKEKQLREKENLLLARQQPQQDGKLRCCSRIHFFIQFVASNTEILAYGTRKFDIFRSLYARTNTETTKFDISREDNR